MALHSAITDKLTGLHNQAYFKHFIDFEIKRSMRQKSHLALLMMDIDDFKQYNDRLGHLAGDRILSEIGKLIKEKIREIDLAVRYGGEEFAVVLPDTGFDDAVKIAERIRQTVYTHPFSREISLPSKKLGWF